MTQEKHASFFGSLTIWLLVGSEKLRIEVQVGGGWWVEVERCKCEGIWEISAPSEAIEFLSSLLLIASRNGKELEIIIFL